MSIGTHKSLPITTVLMCQLVAVRNQPRVHARSGEGIGTLGTTEITVGDKNIINNRTIKSHFIDYMYTMGSFNIKISIFL
jgi:hypothetical protein